MTHREAEQQRVLELAERLRRVSVATPDWRLIERDSEADKEALVEAEAALRSYAALLAQQTPAQTAEGKAIDLGPHPQCSRCKGSGEADNAQFACSCRWSNSPLRFTAESTALLRSAHAIAVRKGAGTAWERFAASIQALGIGPVTARTYRILPSDTEESDESGEAQERITDADAEVERLARKAATLQAENERLKGEHRKDQDTIGELLQSVSARESERNQSRDVVALLEAELATLKERWEQLKAKITARGRDMGTQKAGGKHAAIAIENQMATLSDVLSISARLEESPKHVFFVDGKRLETEKASLTGAEIKALGGVTPIYQLMLEEPGDDPDRVVTDSTLVSLKEGMQFYAAPPAMWGSNLDEAPK